MRTTYTADSLEALAQKFDELAADREHCAKFAERVRDREANTNEAKGLRLAASIARRTTLESKS